MTTCVYDMYIYIIVMYTSMCVQISAVKLGYEAWRFAVVPNLCLYKMVHR